MGRFYPVLFALLPACMVSNSQLSDVSLQSNGVWPFGTTIGSATISGPFNDFIYNRHESLFDPDKQEFEAKYHDINLRLDNTHLSAKMRLRGGVRFCDGFPHFTIKMRKDDQLFGKKKYKIVTHGSHQHDPSASISAPSCGDELGKKPAGSDYRGELQLYQVAAKLLPYYLKTKPLIITYKDSGTGNENTGLSWLIEDFDDTAERYNGKEAEYSRIHAGISWRTAEDEDIYNAALGDEIFSWLATEYRRIEKENPGLSREAISAQLPAIFDIQSSPGFPELAAKAKRRAPLIKSSLKSEQLTLLLSLDRRSVFEGVIFNVMIGNTDWGLLGLNNHSSGIRNFKFVKADGSTYAIPYDFDLAQTAEGLSVSENDYKVRIAQLESDIKLAMGVHSADEFALLKKEFSERVTEFLAASADLPPHLRTSFERFAGLLNQ